MGFATGSLTYFGSGGSIFSAVNDHTNPRGDTWSNLEKCLSREQIHNEPRSGGLPPYLSFPSDYSTGMSRRPLSEEREKPSKNLKTSSRRCLFASGWPRSLSSAIRSKRLISKPARLESLLHVAGLGEIPKGQKPYLAGPCNTPFHTPQTREDTMPKQFKCQNCSKTFFDSHPLRKYCSRSCSSKLSGEESRAWRGGLIKKRCEICNNKFEAKQNKVKSGNGKYCSRACYYKSHKGFIPENKGKKCPNTTGSKNGSWKGGRRKTKDGYIYIYCPSHPFKADGKYVLEHRLVVEKHIGRYLRPEEVVHHINSKRSDNRIKNLMVFKSGKEHRKWHAKNAGGALSHA